MRTKSVGWVFGIACVAAMGCSGDMADEGVTDERLAILQDQLHGMCGTLRIARQDGVMLYLDAYTSGDGDVMMRQQETDDTQRWCFKLVPPPTASGGSGGFAGSSGGAPPVEPTYTVQHRSHDGQFLDAYEGSHANKAVLRDAQHNNSQRWRVSGTSGGFIFRQKSSGRYLRADVSEELNYRVVTSDVSLTTFAFPP
jgi:hypothetical protein